MKFTGQKKGVGAYTKKPFILIMHIYVNHRLIKNRLWALTRRWSLLGRIWYVLQHFSAVEFSYGADITILY